MENKTAVQIFFEDLCHLGYIEYPDESLVQDRLNLALELEKDQIKKLKCSILELFEYAQKIAIDVLAEKLFEELKKPPF